MCLSPYLPCGGIGGPLAPGSGLPQLWLLQPSGHELADGRSVSLFLFVILTLRYLYIHKVNLDIISWDLTSAGGGEIGF